METGKYKMEAHRADSRAVAAPLLTSNSRSEPHGWKSEIKRRLRETADADGKIARLHARNDALRQALERISPSAPRMDGMPSARRRRSAPTVGGAGGDSVGNEVARRDELLEKIRANDAAIERLLLEVAEIDWLLTESISGEERAVLLARYVDGLSWSEVARKTGNSRSRCFRLETTAMRKLLE